MRKNIQIKTRAVIFDMDGVIMNTMPDHFRAWKEIFSQEGITVSHYDVYSREGQRGITSVKEIFAVHNKAFTMVRARRILKRKEKLFKKIVKARFIVGARRLLRRLHGAGFDLALVTGTSRHEACQILPRRIFDLFSVVVTGSDVKNGKPHPEPYLTALGKLGITSCDAVVVENAPFGIASARAAGIQCLALETSLPRTYLTDAQHTFSSISDMCARVCFLRKCSHDKTTSSCCL